MKKHTDVINPTFNFSWDKSKKDISAKVLGKRKQPTPHKPPSTSTVSETESSVTNNSKLEIDNDVTPSYVKRKQKKIKQALEKPDKKKNYSLFDQKPKQMYVTSISGKSVSEKVFTKTGHKFSDIEGIHKHILANLEKNNFLKLTTVQEKALPIILSGKNTLVRSQTGSGKTLAYAVPIVNALHSIDPRIPRQAGVQALIVVPTRELALQTHELLSTINTFQWIVTGHLCGGENRKTEKDRLRKGVHILVGTPGRLLDHVLHTAAFKVNNVRCLVLDEADRLLDMGFRKDIISLVEEIDKAKINDSYNPLALLKSGKADTDDCNIQQDEDKEDIPPLKDTKSKKRQTILLSATLSKGVIELAEFAMKEHVYIDALDDATVSETNLIIPDTVKQQFIITYVKHRLFTLAALIVFMSKKNSKMFVFMASSQMVEFHYELFKKYLLKMPQRGQTKTGSVAVLEDEEDSEDEEEDELVVDMPIFKLHGSMDQKERKDVFNAFRQANKGALLCTDVAARGIDVPTADCIVQYTGPQTDEDYVHRVGRTGRAGKSGSAIIFLTHEEQEYINWLQEHKVSLKKRQTDDILRQLCDLMGESDPEMAATALQRRFENAVAKNRDLYRMACFAYSSWSRFYNSYSAAMRPMFNFKNINLGHYVTSFAIRETPSAVAKIVRGQVKNVETPRLNKKLANHENPEPKGSRESYTKKRKPISLLTSEYASGLEPAKKRKKKKAEDD